MNKHDTRAYLSYLNIKTMSGRSETLHIVLVKEVGIQQYSKPHPGGKGKFSSD